MQLKAAAAGREGGRLLRAPVKETRPNLTAYLENIPEPFGRNERRSRTPALEKGVCRNRRSVKNDIDIFTRHPRLLQRAIQRAEHPFRRIWIGSEDFGVVDFAALLVEQDEIRECTSYINSDSIRCHFLTP